MEVFFLEHRDPIFGLIIFISIALLIAVLSYVWGVFNSKDDKNSVEKFIKKFDSLKTLDKNSIELIQNLDYATFDLLAGIFAKSGDFEKAITIYLVALEKIKDKKERVEILNNLGCVYLKMGALQKAMEIFLQSLQTTPRNQKALINLSVIYEKLKMFNKQLEVLDALKELGFGADEAIIYTKINMISNDNSLNFNQKVEKILEFKDKFRLSKRIIFELFIKHKEPLDNLKVFPQIDDCIDLVWNLNTQINTTDPEYKAVYGAKNGLKSNSKFFDIRAFGVLKGAGVNDAGISFEYTCQKCKNSFPMFFYRCPMCHSLETIQIAPKIEQIASNDETNISFL